MISKGGCRVALPQVTGRLISTAQGLLQNLGLVVVEDVAPANLCTNAQVGEVVFQSVAPGQFALFGSTMIGGVLPDRGDDRGDGHHGSHRHDGNDGGHRRHGGDGHDDESGTR